MRLIGSVYNKSPTLSLIMKINLGRERTDSNIIGSNFERVGTG